MTNIINKVIKNGTEYQIYASGGAAIAVDSELSTTSTNPAQNKVITTAINSKAADNAVVKLTGNQTVAGTKTFSTSPVVPSKNSAASSSNKTVIATEAQVALKQDALTLPSSPTSGHIVTWGANNKTLADGGSIPTVNNSTITFTQGGVSKGTITTNQSSASTIALDAGGNYDNITKSEIQTGTATTQRTVSASVIKESLPTISSESNNILGYAKIRAGNKSDYDAMNSHDANTLYFCIDDGWKPGANTVLYLPLEKDCNDYSGNGYNGTWSSASYTTSGTTKNVAYFNGSYIDLSTFRITEDNTTINVWVKSTSTNTWQEIFDANGSSSTTSTTYFGYNGPGNVSNQYGMQHAVPGGSYSIAYTSGGPFQNVWKNICVVMNTSGTKIYMNGVLQSASSNISGRMVGTPNASIGGRKYGNTNFFRGYISEFIWENKNRTDTEISDYYNATKSNYGL